MNYVSNRQFSWGKGQLTVDGWQLAVGSWQLTVGIEKILPLSPHLPLSPSQVCVKSPE
ncbi:MAG: hypothetical protein ACM65L_19475 [Microcoleus sp.]